MSQSFRIGDVVQWTSQSAGTTKVKVGRVVQVVPPGIHTSGWPGSGFSGDSRNHESYVVEVPQSGNRQPLYYWPRVSGLTLVPSSISGVDLIAAERHRQMEVEGWTAEHDDGYRHDELSLAAISYALPPSERPRHGSAPREWPWRTSQWKPADPIRDLVRAGALIAAEIDRLQRAEARARREEVKG